MSATINIETRQRRGTSGIGLDLKIRLKQWADIARVEDFVNEDERKVVFTVETTDDSDLSKAQWQTLLVDVFDDYATFLNSVIIRIGTIKMASYNYAADRRERELTPADLGVSHIRHKGDPYIHVDTEEES